MDRRTCIFNIFSAGAALFTGALLLVDSEKELKAEQKPSFKIQKSKKTQRSISGLKNKKSKLALKNVKKRIKV